MKNLFLALSLLFLICCTSVPDTFVFDGESSQSIEVDINYVFNKLPRSK